VPAARVVVAKLAAPLAFSVPVSTATPPSRNVTAPVGITVPEVAATVALKVTLWPIVARVGLTLNAVAVSTTVCEIVTVTAEEDDAPSFASPPYDAVILSAPMGSVVVEKLAVPVALSVPVPSTVAPS